MIQLLQFLFLLLGILNPMFVWAAEVAASGAQSDAAPRAPSKLQCISLSNVGESSVIDFTGLGSPTAVSAHYLLERTSANTYTARFNIRYYEESQSSNVFESPQMGETEFSRVYHTRVQSCFDRYRGKIADARGNHLDLTFTDSSSPVGLPPTPVAIDLGAVAFRSNSGQYAFDIDCPTVIHETMHLMSLVDEYEEQTKTLLTPQKAQLLGFDTTRATTAYNCRSISAPRSVMRSQHNALPELQPNCIKTFCQCSANRTEPCDASTVTDQLHCPAGTEQIAEPSRFHIPRIESCVPGMRSPQKSKGKPERNSNIMTLVSPNLDSEPVMSNAQMDVVIHPGCEEMNSTYYSCARNAYRTTEDRGGQGCLAVPPICNTQDWNAF